MPAAPSTAGRSISSAADNDPDAEVVRSSFDALNSGDIDAILAHFHADAVFDATRVLEGTYQGHEEYRRFLEALLESNELRWEEIELRREGDSIVAFVCARGAGVASGVPVERRFGFRYWVEDGLIARQEVHRDIDALVAEIAEDRR